MTSVHRTYDTRIFIKECGSLVAAGYDVVLVAAHGRDELAANGVRIRGEGIPRPAGIWRRWFLTVPQVMRAALRERADVYHFHDPELVIPGLLLRLAGHEVIYDVHEHVPAAIRTKHYIPSIIRKPLAAIVDVVERLASVGMSGVVATSAPIAQRFDAKKTVLIDNFALSEEFRAARTGHPYMERPYWITYVGLISDEHGVIQTLDAIALLADKYDLRLQLGGPFANQSIETTLRSHRMWSRVDYHGYMSRQEMLEIFSRTRLGVVLYQPTPNNVVTSANKVFENMAAGLPVLASNFKTRSEVIDGVGCGITVDPTSPAAIAEGIDRLFSHPDEALAMGRRAAAAIDESFSWESQMPKLTALYEKLISRTRGAAQPMVAQGASRTIQGTRS